MKPHVVVFVFVTLVLSSLITGIGSYRMTAHRIEQDIHQALSKTLMEKRSDRITADTIRTYRQYITMDALRDKAFLAMKVTRRDGIPQLEMVGSADCSMATIYRMSDQRLSYLLMLTALLWIGFFWHRNRFVLSISGGYENAGLLGIGVSSDPSGNVPEIETTTLNLGGLTYSPDRKMFYTHGQQVRLTPMQQQLMELFFTAEDHRLSKQEICDALWPKKDNASETLYTLIRRLKPVVEKNSQLKIESDRGRAYYLTVRS